jgi:hypothetical protein
MRRLRKLSGSPRVRALGKLASIEGAGPGGTASRDGTQEPIEVAATDPLNLQGVLTPDARIPAQPRRRVQVA